ncbi:uncharacterized, partial [Tachysurus ichikawai]
VCLRGLSGADVRGPLLRVRVALVLPPQLWSMPALYLQWLWRKQKPIQHKTRLSDLLRSGAER